MEFQQGYYFDLKMLSKTETVLLPMYLRYLGYEAPHDLTDHGYGFDILYCNIKNKEFNLCSKDAKHLEGCEKVSMSKFMAETPELRFEEMIQIAKENQEAIKIYEENLRRYRKQNQAIVDILNAQLPDFWHLDSD